MSVLNKLQPENVFKHFENICNIPHGSYNTKAISDYIVSVAKDKNLKYHQDEANNVIIYKPASKGYENCETLIIQGHMDMVCEKNSQTIHDFLKDPLNLFLEGDLIGAKGTTLGADDGVAVAIELALIEEENLINPNLELVFTTEEEVGMEGVIALDTNKLKGKYLLNLDSEEEGQFYSSCAGGLTANIEISSQKIKNDFLTSMELLEIKIFGLKGGHSGTDINLGRGNSNKILGRILYNLKKDGILFDITSINGGLKSNAIPRECICEILIQQEETNFIQNKINNYFNEIYAELKATDKSVSIELISKAISENLSANYFTDKLADFLYLVPNGVISMNYSLDNLVETSLNLGVIKTTSNKINITISIRSSLETQINDLFQKISLLCELFDFEINFSGQYPGWNYIENSTLRKLMINEYAKLFKNTPTVTALHAGLECGIISQKMPGIDIVSTGADTFDIHTPNERLSISSTKRTYEFVLAILKAFNKI